MADFVLVESHKNYANNDFLSKYGDFIREKGIRVRVKVRYLFNNST